MEERIQKILARAGICSRRQCEELIKQNKVSVNGIPAQIGAKADAAKDKIMLDGKQVHAEILRYIILHKPKDVVTSVRDPYNKTVCELVPVKERVFPAGRLDKDAEGLVFLTNDGELANKIMHPSFETQKTYVVHIGRPFMAKDKIKLQKGLMIEGSRVTVHALVQHSPRMIEVTLHEGRKHIVKKFFGTLGYFVRHLVRTRIATLSLGKLRAGDWRELSVREVSALRDFLQQDKNLAASAHRS